VVRIRAEIGVRDGRYEMGSKVRRGKPPNQMNGREVAPRRFKFKFTIKICQSVKRLSGRLPAAVWQSIYDFLNANPNQ